MNLWWLVIICIVILAIGWIRAWDSIPTTDEQEKDWRDEHGEDYE